MPGTFASEKALDEYAPQNIPKPIWHGVNTRSNDDMRFHLAEHHDVVDEVPDPQPFVPIVVQIRPESMGKPANVQVWLRCTDSFGQRSLRQWLGRDAGEVLPRGGEKNARAGRAFSWQGWWRIRRGSRRSCSPESCRGSQGRLSLGDEKWLR